MKVRFSTELETPSTRCPESKAKEFESTNAAEPDIDAAIDVVAQLFSDTTTDTFGQEAAFLHSESEPSELGIAVPDVATVTSNVDISNSLAFAIKAMKSKLQKSVSDASKAKALRSKSHSSVAVIPAQIHKFLDELKQPLEPLEQWDDEDDGDTPFHSELLSAIEEWLIEVVDEAPHLSGAATCLQAEARAAHADRCKEHHQMLLSELEHSSKHEMRRKALEADV